MPAGRWPPMRAHFPAGRQGARVGRCSIRLGHRRSLEREPEAALSEAAATDIRVQARLPPIDWSMKTVPSRSLFVVPFGHVTSRSHCACEVPISGARSDWGIVMTTVTPRSQLPPMPGTTVDQFGTLVSPGDHA